MKFDRRTVERLVSTVVLLTIVISTLTMVPKSALQDPAETDLTAAAESRTEEPESEELPKEPEQTAAVSEDADILPTETPAEEQPGFTDGLGNPVTGYRFGQPVPESAAVEDSYYSEAAFIGNSLEQGFMMYSELTTPDYFATQSISIGNIATEKAIQVGEDEYITILDALSRKQYKQVYIMLGINEVDWEEDRFVQCYGELIDRIREQQPGAEIYLQSITPMETGKNPDPQKFTKELILRFNELIQKVAEEKRVHFLYIFECMADENGDLPEGKSFDGIHPYRATYRVWHDYLNTHTIREVRK